MRVRRLIPALSACLAASVSTAVAQPKGAPAKDAPPAPAPAPAKDTPPAPAGTGADGQEVQMTEDAPPADLEGRDENPDAPRILGGEAGPTSIEKPMAPKRTGYPIEETMRPITLPKNMSEVSMGPLMQISRESRERPDGDSLAATSALRARYGITDKIQLGLTYVLGGVYDDPSSLMSDSLGIHPGKAVGVDVTVLLKSWVGVRVGVPVYIDPFAIGVTLGAPMKWQFAGGKYALGALDDFVNIRIHRFLPSLYQEAANADAAVGTAPMGSNTIQSRGSIRFSGYGVMQHQPKLAFIGRIGVVMEDFATTKTSGGGGLSTFMRAGLQYTPRKYLDLGISIGFEDLAKVGSFGPAGLIAFRI